MDRKEFVKSLINKAQKHKILINEVQANKLYVYYKELFTWNKSINLISKNDREKFITRHIIDSIFPLKIVDFKPNDKILDLGSGNGLPGIPLSIMFPSLLFEFLESNRKKCVFLRHIKAVLQVKNVDVLHGRFEELYKKMLNRYKYITIRGKRLTLKNKEGAQRCLCRDGYLLIYAGEKAKTLLPESGETFTYFQSIGNRKIILIPAYNK
jgi:16S rRNA (guanine527-N7)-methyltransferase